jgi:hypothetical protein
MGGVAVVTIEDRVSLAGAVYTAVNVLALGAAYVVRRTRIRRRPESHRPDLARLDHSSH